MKKIIVLSICVILGILFAGEIRKGFLSLLIAIDCMRPPEKALMGKVSSPPSVTTVTVPGAGMPLQADLYSPPSGGSHPGLLLVHGLDTAGNRDDRFVLLAKNLARAGFLVLAPDFGGLRNFRIRLSDAEGVVRSFLYLRRMKNSKPGGVMAGFGYGVGPMLLAAADPRVRDNVRTIVGLGGYGDFREVILFLITGMYEYGGSRGYLRPEQSFRWAFLYKNLDLIRSKSDRETLGTIIEQKNRFDTVREQALSKTLGDEGKAVYAFFSNADQKKSFILYENLPVSFREYLVQLSPVRVLRHVKAYCILIHSMEDYSIPYTESIRIADAVADRSRVRLELLPGSVFTEPGQPRSASYGGFVNAFRLFRSIYELLKRSE